MTILPPPQPTRIIDAFEVRGCKTPETQGTYHICVTEDEVTAREFARGKGVGGGEGFVRPVRVLVDDGMVGHIIKIGEPVVVLPRIMSVDQVRQRALSKLDSAERAALGINDPV
jgi:hypothetical protein